MLLCALKPREMAYLKNGIQDDTEPMKGKSSDEGKVKKEALAF